MKRKKGVSLLLTGSMTICLLAGCSNSDSENASSQKEALSKEESTLEQALRVAVFEGGYGTDMWTDVVTAFETSHPGVTVELTIDKKLKTRLALA